MKTKDRCYFLARKYNYVYDTVMQALHREEEVVAHSIQDRFICTFEGNYPARLHDLLVPPIHVCYQGNLSVTQYPTIGIIGSRRNSAYGAWVVSEIMKQLDKEIVIVSGLAMGIDGIAHEQAIHNGMKTIGVIGSGLATIYPKQNAGLFQVMARNHLILSEYQYEEPIRKHYFVARNRLIAALSDVLVVIESKIRSGSSTTVKEALELGRDIYCVPHRLSDELGGGNHWMIQEGANIIYDIASFCREMNGRNNLTNQKIPLR